MNPTFRPDLQGVRAIAILLVVCAHADVPLLQGGFIGVDVFFVLSGYLITGLLVREHAECGRISWSDFVVRRLKRLLPALLVMILLSAGLAVMLLSSSEVVEQMASAPFAATWTSNLFFAFDQLDYFAELRLRDIYLHTWSLGVEEQYYLFWPVVVMLLAGSGWKRWYWGLTAAFLSSFALSLYWQATQPQWAFYQMPSRVWQFALGAAVFVWVGQGGAAMRSAGARLWLGGAGLLLVLGSGVGLSPQMAYPGYWALLPSLGAASMIAAAGRPGTRGMLGLPPLVWLGDRAYSLYLWHWPMLMFAYAWGLSQDRLAIFAVVLFSLGLAHLSHRYVELPFWKGRWSDWRRGVTFSAAATSAALVVAVMLGITALERTRYDPAKLLATSARVDTPKIYRVKRCDTWTRDATVIPCQTVPNDDGRRAVIVGDSIGMQWYPAMADIFVGDPAWHLVAYTKSACAILDHEYEYDVAGGPYTICFGWRDALVETLLAQPPELLFIGSAAYGFGEDAWVGGMRRLLDRLSPAVGQLVLIAGTPSLSFDGPGCLERWLGSHPDAKEPDHTACLEAMDGSAPAVADFLRQAAKPYPNVRVLNPGPLVCPGGRCSAWDVENGAVFRDRQHLTASFARALAPRIRDWLVDTGVLSAGP